MCQYLETNNSVNQIFPITNTWYCKIMHGNKTYSQYKTGEGFSVIEYDKFIAMVSDSA